MAYITQATKKQIHEALKEVIPAGWKWTTGTRHNSTFVLNIWQGDPDLMASFNRSMAAAREARGDCAWEDHDSIELNDHYIGQQFDREDFNELFSSILDTIRTYGNWFDKSDTQTDYFFTAFYISINLGRWDKPFKAAA